MSVDKRSDTADDLMQLQRRLARNIRALRRARSLTVEAAAARARLSWHYWRKIEAGEVNATMRTLCQIANALEVDPRELLIAELPPVTERRRRLRSRHG